MREVYANGHGKIIKFVEGRYGDTVHRFCASKGNAPPLLSCELVSPNGIWWRVEMEEWELKSRTEATNPDDAQSQLKLLLDELRENNFVHGDLRPPNVFLHGSQEKVVLIDFDWAGVAGVDIYPYGMNLEINWPKGAHGGAKLDLVHDLEWLYRMFPSESKC
ncbi:Protein kinase-like domain [Plasmopara halstedii]|uniref:Protein kinase-like domain n=1 Tax=Plasmopara halstedii TaxID=4781 RepID=A0A0P1AXV5_PLAHL|nr:Protein kinase-like domain [Plasmopara halstedii]CEG45927.1 Protein kinase-like domain [Plasmopara halstedii]|eukprot:XP_024582296.1 Protein kinase-like domain [Plasmopara halstedii]